MEEIFSVKEVAQHLRVSRGTVRRWIKAGKLQASNVSLGSKRPNWKITQSQLNQLLQDGRNK